MMNTTNPAVSPPMVVLRPGDKVLVTLAGESDPETVTAITATLQDTFPSVEFVVMDGVASVLVGGP